MSAPERPISLTIRQIGIATSLKVTVESFFITVKSPIATTSRSRTLSYGPIRQLSEIPGKFNRSQAKQRICSVRLRFAQRVCSTMLGAYRHFLFWSQVLFVSVCRRVEETVWVSALGASPVSRTYTHERSTPTHQTTKLAICGLQSEYKTCRDSSGGTQRQQQAVSFTCTIMCYDSRYPFVRLVPKPYVVSPSPLESRR